MTGLLDGRTALVTGGTRGIGLGIAQALRDQGAQVAVTGINGAEFETARSQGFTVYELDVRDQQQCDDVVARFSQEFGGLSILASNAGVYPQNRIEDMTDENLDFIFDINLKGMVHMIKSAMPCLIDDGAGRIVVTSSITGNYTGFPGWAHYGATKAAQLGFVRTAAIELAPHKITVNAVLPGNILAPGLQALGDEYLKEMADTVPLGFLGEPTDIGNAVAFLASEQARYITGQGIVVDGGQMLPESSEAFVDL